MAAGEANPKVDAYLAGVERWRAELEELRRILLDCELTEEIKWRQPCYTFQNGNVAVIGEMKDCCVLSFFKGSLLTDPEGVLTAPGPNSRAARTLRFTSTDEIAAMETVLRAYIDEAIGLEKAGRKVDFAKDRAEAPIPDEVQSKLDDDPELKAAFEALTPGRRRGYIIYFAAPKQAKTRAARVDKHRQRILDGKGIHDR
jgi:uncharacterized protein YdeI (YjbR/CyaY-like superfamily)